MKTMYLHIGTPKTATTAIQLFCDDNQKVLQSKGYVYPIFPYRYDIIQKERNAHFLIDGLYGKNYAERLEISEIQFAEGFQTIYELFETYDNIILSDEGIWNHSFLRGAPFWERMQKEMDKGIFQLKIVVYLRRQDDYLFSWWNQQVKEGGVMACEDDWNTVIETLPMIKLDYYDMIKKIEGKVGKGNVIVRTFEKGDLYGGSIYADFLHAIGLEFTDEYIVNVPLANPSLNKDDVEIKRLLNKIPGISSEVNVFFKDAITEHSKCVKDDNRISMFSEEEHKSFMNRYEEGNQRIAREYFNKEQLFDTTYKAEGKWEPDGLAMSQSLTALMGEMMMYVTAENAKLKKEIKSLQKEVKELKASSVVLQTRKRISSIKHKLTK